MILFYDSETFCETPIRDGTHRYAEGAEIMVETWAVDDGPVQVSDRTAGEPGPFDLFDPEDFDRTVIHNSGFDRTVLRHNGLVLSPERIFDTMVAAMSHGLPGGLDKLCGILGVSLDQAKDKAGKQLIQLFCKPRPKNSALRRATRETHPTEWQRFLDYAGSDILAMRAIYKKLPRWNYDLGNKGHREWCLDQRMNDRGFLVDQQLARDAIRTVDKSKKLKDARVQQMTKDEVRSATQRDMILKHLLAEYGVDLPDMQSGTLERRMQDESLPPPVRELLAIRLSVSTTSSSKYGTLLKAVSSDGRLRGTLQFCGAPRTRRWSGRTFQPQNLIRTPDWFSPEEQDQAIQLMHNDAADLIYDDPIEIANYCVRGSIVAAEGKKLVTADLAQIEARVLPWLAGEQWKVDSFAAYDTILGYDDNEEPIRKGPDVYRVTAGRLLGKPATQVEKHERQSHGKVVELACGYGGSTGAFAQFAAIYGVDLPQHEIYQIVRDWREAHPALCDWDNGFWAQLDSAARDAVRSPGKVFQAGERIAFERWRNWLKMHLPSGGFLSYAAPAIAVDPRRPQFGDSLCYMGLNNYTRRWERIFTYGGKLSADATQSTAREVLAAALPEIEDAGYDPVLLVHDEVVTEASDDDKYSLDKLIAMLTRKRSWTEGLPVAADGYEAYRYRK